MMKKIIILTFLALAVSSQEDCRFAENFSRSELLLKVEARKKYIENVMHWEGQFMQDGVGFNLAAGITYDGHPLNYTTGEISGDPHLFSAPSKECIQVGILAKIVQGDPVAQLIISNDSSVARETALTILTNKINSYYGWNASYPGFGGWFPWFTINESGMSLLNGWTDQVPGLDNGELIWSMSALIKVLYDQNITDLADKYSAYYEYLKTTAAMVFYNGNGYVRAVTQINDIYANPTWSNYMNPPSPYYLDDPYEGELFVVWLCLYGGLNQTDIDLIWQNKIPLIQPAEYPTPTANITTERGYFFSSHEKWKFLLLPYTDVPIMKRIFVNGEKARTWDAFINLLPGMFAAVNDVCPPNEPIPDYIGSTGIQQLAFQNVTRRDVTTGYATFPVFLADPTIGLVWYDNYLKGPKGQTPYGAVEAIAINGSLISPLTTWDSKMTTVLAILGGLIDINREILKTEGLYDTFYGWVNTTWGGIFKDLKGEHLPFMIPTVQISHHYLQDFTMCSSTTKNLEDQEQILYI